jgi:hypothetical protein
LIIVDDDAATGSNLTTRTMSILEEDDVVPIVVVVVEEEEEGLTQKIRLRVSPTITGAQLECAILKHLGIEDDSSSLQVFTEAGIVLLRSQVALRTRLLRCSRRTPSSARQPPLAITGRYFAYNENVGIEVYGKQLHIRESPNEPGGGTGLNILDAAILLYVW